MTIHHEQAYFMMIESNFKYTLVLTASQTAVVEITDSDTRSSLCYTWKHLKGIDLGFIPFP